MREVKQSGRAFYGCALILGLLLALVWHEPAWARDPAPPANDILKRVGFDQQLNAQAPLDTVFQDETGQRVALSTYFGKRPVILELGYFECPNICSLTRANLVNALLPLKFDVGKDFDVVMVSIDPKEAQGVAQVVKQQTVQAYHRPGTEAGWHFLTGSQASIERLAAAVGFRYAYDPQQQQFAHPSGIVLLTPAGKIAHYLLGIDYKPIDLRLGLVQAGNNQIGSPVDQLLLLCYHYDPVTGRYSVLIMNVLRLAGLITVVLLGGLLWVLFRTHTLQGPLLN